MVEGEKDALKVYSCPGDNMLGLEKMVIFKDRVVTVFDKKIMNSSRYAFKAEEMSRTGSFHAFASLTGNLNYECKAGLYIDDGKYIVLCYFTYNAGTKIWGRIRQSASSAEDMPGA